MTFVSSAKLGKVSPKFLVRFKTFMRIRSADQGGKGQYALHHPEVSRVMLLKLRLKLLMAKLSACVTSSQTT